MLTLNILTVLFLITLALLSLRTAAQLSASPPTSMTPKQQLAWLRSAYATVKQQNQKCLDAQAQVQAWHQVLDTVTALVKLLGTAPNPSGLTIGEANWLVNYTMSQFGPLSSAAYCPTGVLQMTLLLDQFASQAEKLGLNPNIDPPDNPARILTQLQIMSGAFSASDDGYGYYYGYSFDDLW